MPENRMLYLRSVLIIAAVSLWLGGVVLVVLGVVLEFWKARKAHPRLRE